MKISNKFSVELFQTSISYNCVVKSIDSELNVNQNFSLVRLVNHRTSKTLSTLPPDIHVPLTACQYCITVTVLLRHIVVTIWLGKLSLEKKK